MKYTVTEYLRNFHAKHDSGIKWALSPEGISIEGAGVERSTGQPLTVTRVWEDNYEAINKYALQYDVPVELIVATISTESGGKSEAVREEPGFISDEQTPHKVSPGIMQTLISTARETLHKRGVKKEVINREWLLIAENSINAGTSYISEQKSKTQLDPVLVAAAYNAGGIYFQNGDQNRFKLRQYPIGTSKHCDRFIRFFNDYWAVLQSHSIRPSLSFFEFFNQETALFSLPLDLNTKIEVTQASIKTYYTHTEKDFVGGYFPVGGNTSWHGGVHLLGSDGQSVHAVADGEIVAARMPVLDPESDLLSYGSRNFILIRHKLNEENWYSLYYHLKSIDLDSEEAKALKWLSAPALKFSSGSNMREVPTTEDNDPIHTFQNGDVAEILNKNDNPWYEVLRTSDGVSGFVKFSSSRMEEITTINNRLMCLFGEEVGHVVQIEKAVKAGEVIGYVGQGITLEDNEIIKKPILHWSVFSQKTMGDFWTQIEDSDQNYTCNSERLIKLIDENCDKKLSCEEITRFFADEEKAKGMRSYACRFKSEWSVDWNSFREEVKKQGIRACTSKLELYNFWDDAVECDNNLPSDGHVWHYNPITFIERQLFATARATFLADCFEPDKTLPLPSKTCNLLSRIGQYVSANSAENIQIIAHSGVEGDTLDPLALSQARGDALKWIFTLDKNAIEGHLDENRWGNRERKIMLSYFNHYSGTINDDDENISDMVSSVKSFQEEHGLAVDGDAGPATFTKFFEVMLENAGISGLKHIEVVAAGENHPAKETVQNEPEQNTGNRVLEVLIWKSDIEPSVEQYAQEAQKTYDAWVGNIAHELSADQGSQILAGGDIFERDLFLYDAQNDTYLRIDNQYVGKFYEAVDECNSYVEQIEEVRENEIDEQAVGKIKKIKESFVEYLKKSRTLAKDANESGESTAMADPDAGIDTELKEFLAVNVVGEGKPKHKGWVYVRSDKVKDHWRKSSEKTLHNLFSEEEKDESGGLKDELKEKFKEKILDELKHEKVLWGDEDPKDILAPRFKFATGKLGEDSDRWDFSAGAQFLRFSAGASLKSEINLTNLEVNLEMAGSVTFAVAEAKVEGNWYIPDKKGIDVPKFLQDSERKITGLLNGASARPPTRTTFTPEQRSLYLRLKIGLSAKGFVGATASFAFPRLELKPVKGDDPDRERLAMATLEGEAFAGAQGQVKITGSADWCPECEGEEWKGMVTGEAGLAGTAGAGAEGRLHFGYRDGNIRFACSFQATFVVGGKAFWDFDLGLKEGLEFLCQMARCVDYHYVAEIAEDLYEAMGAYKFSLLITPQTGLLLGGLYLAKDLDEHVEKAKDFKDTSVKFFRMVDNFVDEKIQDHIFGASKNKLALLDSRIKTIKTSPPEAIARYLLIEMKTKEQDDFIYIPKVLEAIESDHEFRWVLRYVGLFKVLHNIHSRNPGASSIEYKGVVLQVKGNTIIASNKELRQIMEKMDPDGGDKVKNMMIKVGATRLLEFGDYYNRINYKKSYCDALIKLYQKNGVKL